LAETNHFGTNLAELLELCLEPLNSLNCVRAPRAPYYQR